MNRRNRVFAVCALCAALPLGYAQNSLDNPDWKEENAAPAPTYSVHRALLLDLPQFVSVKIGVDPETIAVGADGIVRYVAVIRNASGANYGVYEGIRCLTGQVKTYARSNANGVWNQVASPAWKDWSDNLGSQHAKVFARQAACDTGLARTKDDILSRLRSGKAL